MSVEQIYEENVKALSAEQRFQLATLILSDISPRAVIDYSEEWSEEDLREATEHSLRRASFSFCEDEADV